MYVMDPQGEVTSNSETASSRAPMLVDMESPPQPHEPIQSFIPPVFSAPFGAVTLPGLSDRELMQYFVSVASRTASAINANGASESEMHRC